MQRVTTIIELVGVAILTVWLAAALVVVGRSDYPWLLALPVAGATLLSMSWVIVRRMTRDGAMETSD